MEMPKSGGDVTDRAGFGSRRENSMTAARAKAALFPAPSGRELPALPALVRPFLMVVGLGEDPIHPASPNQVRSRHVVVEHGYAPSQHELANAKGSDALAIGEIRPLPFLENGRESRFVGIVR